MQDMASRYPSTDAMSGVKKWAHLIPEGSNAEVGQVIGRYKLASFFYASHGVK